MKAHNTTILRINDNFKWLFQIGVTIFLTALLNTNGMAQLPQNLVLAEYDFENGTAPALEDSNANLSTMSVNGVNGYLQSGTCTGNSYRTEGWTTDPTIDTSQYYEFTITPEPGHRLQLLKIELDNKRGTAGPELGQIRSSLDGFQNPISPFPANPQNQVFYYNNVNCDSLVIHLSALGPQFSNIHTAVTFRIYAYKAATVTGVLDIDNLKIYGQVVPGGPLPIELISFDGKPEDDVVKLQWITAAEINNDFYTIERSNNGEEFEIIATIEGAGNSSEMLEYYFNDKAPLDGVSFYRLKQTDYNGEFSYSKTIAVKFNVSENKISLYPNPASHQLNVEYISNNDELVKMEVLDMSGKLVLQQDLEMSAGQYQWSLPVADLKSGTYMVRLYDGQESVVKRFIKN